METHENHLSTHLHCCVTARCSRLWTITSQRGQPYDSGNVRAVLLRPHFSNVEDSHASAMAPLSNLSLSLSENARRLLNVAKRIKAEPEARMR
jgi:hypothetical protein